MNITSKCADMDIPLYEIFNLNPDDFIDENITDLPLYEFLIACKEMVFSRFQI